MSKTIPVQIGSIPTKISHDFTGNLVPGEQFKENFPRNIPTVVGTVSLELTVTTETALVTISAKDREGNVRRLNQEYSSGGFLSYFDKHLYLGANEYLVVEATKDGGGDLTGGTVDVVGQIVSM